MVGKSFKRILVSLCAASVLVACGHSDEEEQAPNKAPLISGTPMECVTENNLFDFRPQASDPDGDPLTFSISNQPLWTEFNTNSGRLNGTPGAADIGQYDNIRISVSDGNSGRSLPSFTVTVTAIGSGTVTLTWMPPTTNGDGTVLTDLDAYKIYYGTENYFFDKEIQINNPGIASFVVENLCPNTYYFATTAINSQGLESDFSNIASKTVL
ncbi:MAG: fibronectin type III domain-containing protein [Proteobacteria bacterium]|nr:fibronectin type III domain-containing protein [Pseudomonadota bacterium]